MGRIRTIKPEFFTSEDVVALTPLARLFFQACWCEADREGRLEWKPRTMKMRYFPCDDCDITAIAREVLEQGIVKLYEADGQQYAYIPSFLRHQHINPREAASKLPDPDRSPRDMNEHVRAPGASARVSDASARVDDAQGGKEGKGKEGKEDSELRSAAAEPPRASVVEMDDMKKRVWEDGIRIIRTLTGKGDGPSRNFLGKLLKEAKQDFPGVLAVLQAAERERPVDPASWIVEAIRARGAPRSGQSPAASAVDRLFAGLKTANDPFTIDGFAGAAYLAN
ncbi:MAG TPA: hypothetical protein VFG62_08680 [Rhodopila sp.]|jgi:hypothetical protein|nr:hypothetical protein [Rhodopila sp.]